MASQYELDTNSRLPHRLDTNHLAAGNSDSVFREQASAPPIKLGPTLALPDYLGSAVKSAAPAPAPKPDTASDQSHSGHGSSPEIADSDHSASQSARNKLAQEALLADPGQIRKAFPGLMKDLGLLPEDWLNMSDIDTGLNDPKVSQSDKNLLTVMRAGYSEFSQLVYPGGTVVPSDEGICPNSLSFLDKAINRNLAEDPILDQEESWGGAEALLGGIMATSVIKAIPPAYKTILGVGVGILAFVGFEIIAEKGAFKASNDKKYDKEKNAYTTFVTKFETDTAQN